MLEALAFPLLGSPKLDGVRALMFEGVLVSRSLKAIPNVFLQKKALADVAHGLDGELIVGDPMAGDENRMFASTSLTISKRRMHLLPDASK